MAEPMIIAVRLAELRENMQRVVEGMKAQAESGRD